MIDLPTYEIELPISFDEVQFRDRTQCGEDHLWLICIEPPMGRFVLVRLEIHSLNRAGIIRSADEVRGESK